MSTFEMIVWCVIAILILIAASGIVFMLSPCGGSRQQEPDLVIEGDRKPGDGF
jgi:hypothetical protein